MLLVWDTELEMYIDCMMSSFSLVWKACCNDDIIALDHRPDTAELKRLDGSVKKNSAFVKKLVKIATQLYMYVAVVHMHEVC